jgi:cytosine/adenosine deaminase-related metal-dependent hydrolase
MDPAIGNLRGDVLIDGSRIERVGPEIDVGDCEVIDATDMVVMPGLVDAHRHLWYAGIRGGNMDAVLADIAAAQWGKLGPAFTPPEVHAFTRAGIVDCLDNGITTVFDWCHVINSPEHAEAAVDAHKSLGMRAVFGYGGSMALKVQELEGDTDAGNWDHAAALRERELSGDAGRLTMALALPGLQYADLDVTRSDVAAAREMGVPMSFHVGIPQGPPPKEAIRHMAQDGLLGPDMSFVHCCDTSDNEFRLVADAGATAMSCPVVDAAVGFGVSPTPRMRAQGLKPCFAADAVSATSGDLFEEARFGLLLDRDATARAVFARGESVDTHEGRITARQALEAVTSAAARSCWLDAEIGSLTPGKQADVILLQTRDLNLWPVSNLESAVMAGAHGGNVDTVLVAGEVVKRDGRLVGVDLDAIRRDLVEARDRLYEAGDFNDIQPAE